jgi:hypothetical protein
METNAPMDVQQAGEELTERKVVRRGLLAGLASLGAAAAFKLSGAEKASAANNDSLLLGNMGDTVLGNPVPPGTAQTATGETRIKVSAPAGNPGVVPTALQVVRGGGSQFINSAAIVGTCNLNAGVGITGHDSSPNGSLAIDAISLNGTGLRAITSKSSGWAIEARGSSNATGIYAFSNASGGLANGTGIAVRAESSGGAGVFAKSVSAPGVDGVSTSSLGVRGTSTDFVGVVGISTNNHGLYGSSNSPTHYGIVAENVGGGPGLLVTGNAQIFGALQVFGVKNAVIKMADGSNAAVYCQESPEPYFEDFGRAQLAGGVANVPLEREFATLVAGGDYMVFLTPQGDTKGLYVSRQDARGYEVREVQGGTGNVPFTYRIVTKRKDVEAKRFARVSTESVDKVAGIRARLGMGSGASFPPGQNYAPPANVLVDPSLPVIPPAGTAIPGPPLSVHPAP